MEHVGAGIKDRLEGGDRGSKANDYVVGKVLTKT